MIGHVNRERIEKVLGRLLETSGEDLAAAYLFGSVARQTDRSSSDVDVAVLFREAPAPKYSALPLRLEGALEKHLGRTVQVVVMNTAPVDLIHRILRDGRLLLDRDRSARIQFEVKARNEYFDLLPFLRRYRKQQRSVP
jgi:hypothetical protein